MRRPRAWMTLAAMALLGGCAHPAAQREAEAVPVHGKAVASRSPVVDCATTDIVIATVSKCGAGGLTFGVAAE